MMSERVQNVCKLYYFFLDFIFGKIEFIIRTTLATTMMVSFMEVLPKELKLSIVEKIQKPKNINNFLSTNRSNRELQTPVPLSYSSNHSLFRKAYYEALYYADSHSTIVIKNNPLSLSCLVAKYTRIHDTDTPYDNLKKFKLYNKGVIIYLQILNRVPSYTNSYYLYGLAQVISYKSAIIGDIPNRKDVINKYRILEFEVCKLYIMRYLIAPNKNFIIQHLKDAITIIKYYNQNGILNYVVKANPSELLCTMFLSYYFYNTDVSLSEFLKTYSITKTPFITSIPQNMTEFNAGKNLKENILKQCIRFMITDIESVSHFTEKARALDLSLIDTHTRYGYTL